MQSPCRGGSECTGAANAAGPPRKGKAILRRQGLLACDDSVRNGKLASNAICPPDRGKDQVLGCSWKLLEWHLNQQVTISKSQGFP